MHVEIMEPGLATTVQDLGRSGGYNVGIPPSGALDQTSAKLANLLVGNPVDAAVLEAPYLGPKLAFDGPGVVAVTGGQAPVLLNGVEVDAWEAFPVAEGDVLSFGYIQQGARLYIAVAGGFDVPEVLGSRSTYGLGALGGYQGRPLRAGDRLPVGAAAGPFVPRRVPERSRPAWSREVELRVVLGLYDYRLTEEATEALLGTVWTLTPVADRTGFRYSGAKLTFTDRTQPFGAGSDPSNIVDAGYPIGSIQVPSGSEPIILHRDAVSGGGYAMVGTVISVDMDIVGQSAPGTNTRLRAVSLDEALRARRHAQGRFADLAQALA
ncbi:MULTISPECIES: biotin-dependent carboxyltransferase family protein [Nocardia]|uniref:5-oxoprolinase subunit C family protein n=1 Tax=Nocardia TaxID=1817 RepID=UPI000BEF30E3|nr:MULTISPECIES: biotin-dependent carboxyltransferase family protein [Nocardia]MBF6185687.1 biotin-dependent carboxyltransferase [Nocardia farcinica]MBF6311532.1 biotin-dependent carboxyltransferase [Nocardia farcinica]MBF6360168.1 biotin-dependent carboxyltransferase [Nocardia farcinica]MBF6408516.1 biotin-dependent carboxyltransferase [Nocardia farcinica]PEH76727.1 allophanate hydrolase [Nocardia sp. FDAARGOS_372]